MCTESCRIPSTRTDPTNARVCQNFAVYTECNVFNCNLPSSLQSYCRNRRLTKQQTLINSLVLCEYPDHSVPTLTGNRHYV